MHLILHIGSPKTGTTAIQQTLTNHRLSLIKHKILYPEIERENNHNILAVKYCDKVPRMYWNKYGEDHLDLNPIIDAAWNNIQYQIGIYKPKTLLISGELFFSLNKGHGSPVENFLEDINRFLPGIKSYHFLCYLRSPASHYISIIHQRIKATSYLPAPKHIDYEAYLSPWQTAGKLSVRKYDITHFYENDILSDMFHECNIKPNPFSGKRIAFINKSLSPEATYLLHKFRSNIYGNKDNYFNEPTKNLINALRAAEATLGGYSYFSKPVLKPKYQTYFETPSPGTNFLKKRYGLQFQEINYDLKPCPPPETHPNTIDDIFYIDTLKLERFTSVLLLSLSTVEGKNQMLNNIIQKTFHDFNQLIISYRFRLGNKIFKLINQALGKGPKENYYFEQIKKRSNEYFSDNTFRI